MARLSPADTEEGIVERENDYDDGSSNKGWTKTEEAGVCGRCS